MLFYVYAAARLERKSFFACTQFLLKLISSAKKIDFVEPKGLGALRQAQDKLQADKAAIKKLHQFRIGNQSFFSCVAFVKR